MESILTAVIIVLALGLVAMAVAVLRLKNQNPEPDASHDIQSLLHQITMQHGQQLQQTTNLVLQQLGEHREAQERTTGVIHGRLDQTNKIFSDVQSRLTQMDEANKRLVEMSRDMASLQKILQAPKLRGTLGEMWLHDLISQILPPDRYKMQHTFRTGDTCDAAIFLRDGMVLPIDSKFSLENFLKMLDAPDDAQKAVAKKQFVSDVKKRIDEIAKKYVLPHEGTLDIALMYVPAENVYYQAFIQDEAESGLLRYAFEHKVVPVSPSSFYAYLQLVLMGLRGMEIEKSAKEIQRNLGGLRGEFGKFRDTYEKVGTHLRHAQQSYEMTDKRLGGIENRLVTIGSAASETLEAGKESEGIEDSGHSSVTLIVDGSED